MTKRRTVFLLLPVLVLATASYGQTKKNATDYLNVPGPLVFDSKSYNLAWSSHPSENYYKQEYIVAGDNIAKFNTMIMIEMATGNTKIKDAVATKIAELKKMKELNPMINYETFDNPKTGEYMIDFLLSENTAGGKDLSVVERNVYRYLPFAGKTGQTGIVLFGVSTRSYGNNIRPYLISLKSKKTDLVNKLAAYKIPELKITK